MFVFLPTQNLLRREPLKLVDGGESQRTFIYIKDAIEAVLLMIVCLITSINHIFIWINLVFDKCSYFLFFLAFQENPARASGHIFNVGNPNNEVTVRQLAEMMTQVSEVFYPAYVHTILSMRLVESFGQRFSRKWELFNEIVFILSLLHGLILLLWTGIFKSKWRRFNRDSNCWCQLQRVLWGGLWWQW